MHYMQAARDFKSDGKLRQWCVAIKIPEAKVDLIVAALEAQDFTDVDALVELSEKDLAQTLGPLATLAVKAKILQAVTALMIVHAAGATAALA
jgi:hypothetical protein